MEMTPLLLLLCAGVCCTVQNSRLRKFSLLNIEHCNWTTAQNYCIGNQSNLVTVYNQKEYEQLRHLLRNENQAAWIGLIHQMYKLKWSNGDSVNASAWPSLPSANQTSYCAVMHPNETWSLCTDVKNFMCYTKQPYDHLFEYQLIEQNLTWYEAQSYCQTNHSDLVSIMNETQKEEVMYAGKNSTAPFWIGLLYDDWEWVDGGNFAYRKWSTKVEYPEANQNFTCIQQGLDGIISVPTDHTSNIAICSEGSVHIHIIKKNKTWEEALTYCNKHHNGLLYIESAGDLTAIDQQFNGTNLSGPVWLSLRQSRLFGFWIWTNGKLLSPENWSNWEEGRQPKQPLSHLCAAMATKEGYKWVDQDCMLKLYFVCEHMTGPTRHVSHDTPYTTSPTQGAPHTQCHTTSTTKETPHNDPQQCKQQSTGT